MRVKRVLGWLGSNAEALIALVLAIVAGLLGLIGVASLQVVNSAILVTPRRAVAGKCCVTGGVKIRNLRSGPPFWPPRMPSFTCRDIFRESMLSTR